MKGEDRLTLRPRFVCYKSAKPIHFQPAALSNLSPQTTSLYV